jgi:hypothetical protein
VAEVYDCKIGFQGNPRCLPVPVGRRDWQSSD